MSVDETWAVLDSKIAAIEARGMAALIVTQFAFDPDAMMDWVLAARGRGIAVPIRLGVPGPTSIKALLRFAARCGVGASASVMKKYGVSITNLLGQAGPDKLVDAFATGLTEAQYTLPGGMRSAGDIHVAGDVLFYATLAETLLTIDKDTGQVLNEVDHGLSALWGLHFTDQLYGYSGREIYSVNHVTGQTELIASLDLPSNVGGAGTLPTSDVAGTANVKAVPGLGMENEGG